MFTTATTNQHKTQVICKTFQYVIGLNFMHVNVNQLFIPAGLKGILRRKIRGKDMVSEDKTPGEAANPINVHDSTSTMDYTKFFKESNIS